MDNSQLMRLALIISLLGLLSLVLLVGFVQPVPYSPNRAQLNREVKLTGKVLRVQQTEKVAFIELAHMVKTEVALFKPRALSLKENDTVTVRGVIEEYQGQKNLVAYSIER